MAWAEMFPAETDAALADRAANPVPLPAPRRSAWAELGDVLAAPFTGAAQGVNESLRVWNRLTPKYSAGGTGLRAGTPRSTSDTMRRAEDAAAAEIDDSLRSGADYWRPDPMTAGWVTNYLHDAARVVTKFSSYSLLGGAPAAIGGTALDEGATSFMNLRDQGVDAGTAAKVAAVHGAATAVSAGIAPVGSTPLRSALLVGLSGPGAYMAESALSRNILQAADYPQLAATFDPSDTLGLALSLVPGAAVAAGVHGARARAARRAEPVVPPSPELVDAAHVQLQHDMVEAGQLSKPDDLAARVTHRQALAEARAALDEGRRAELPAQAIDESRARPVLDHLNEQLRAADVPRLMNEARIEDSPLSTERGPAPSQATEAATGSDAITARADTARAPVAGAEPAVDAQARAPLQRAIDVARERPDLPVRLEDDGSPATPAADLVRTEAQRASQEASEAIKATQAAIECFLKLGVQ